MKEQVIDPQVLGLSLLLQLSRRVRLAKSLEEVAFIAVNESKQFFDYRQAALWLPGQGVVAVSGTPLHEGNAPYILWLASLCKTLIPREDVSQLLPEEVPDLIAADWGEWLPAELLACPLDIGTGDGPTPLLLLARDNPWQEHEFSLARELASIYGYALRLFTFSDPLTTRFRRLLRTGWLKGAALAALLGILLIPVHITALAPAEVVPKDPFLVRAPLDGVIERFLVRPNESVTVGQLLFELDKTNLKTRLGSARKSYEVSEEEYRQSAQLALNDERGRLEVIPRRGKMQEKAEDLAFSRAMLRKVEVTAPRQGIAVFTAQSDWVGRGVALGEKILLIADPKQVELQIHLPVADAIDLAPGAAVTLYLTTDPRHPRQAVVRYAAYRAEVTPSSIVAYRLKAEFTDKGPTPRIGLTGTARIEGQKSIVAYALFRRPLTVLRQRLGW